MSSQMRSMRSTCLSRLERHALTLLCVVGSIASTPLVEPVMAQLWEPADLQMTIGRLDGDAPEVFGLLRTIEVDAAGNVYVLEEQTSDIHVFDRDGGHITSYRRRGQGPRELLGIRGSDLDSEGVLHVADVANGRISTFELDGDSLAFEPSTPREGYSGKRRSKTTFPGSSGETDSACAAGIARTRKRVSRTQASRSLRIAAVTWCLGSKSKAPVLRRTGVTNCSSWMYHQDE